MSDSGRNVDRDISDLAEVRDMLDKRYDEAKCGRVKLIDGEKFFAELRRREEDLRKKRPAKRRAQSPHPPSGHE